MIANALSRVPVYITLLLLALLGASACGDETATGPAPNTVGPLGGTLTFANGAVTLVFPPGAVSQEITVSVGTASGFPSNSRLVTGTVYEFGPVGIQFTTPVDLTIRYAPGNLPVGIRESELRLFEVVGGVWQESMGGSVDTAGSAVTASIGGFSVKGVLGVPVAAVDVVPASATIQVGETLQLTATARDGGGNALPERALSWSSSDSAVVEVEASGLASGVAIGPAIVTATAEGQEGTASLNVVEAARPTLELVTSALASPVFLTAPSGDLERLFVVEQGGVIRIVRNASLVEMPFLDLRGQLSAGGERGLLSMVFHPDYSQNGEFFVNYTDPNGDTRVVRYWVSSDPDVADAGSAELIISIEQPYSNHNGGQLAFGPDGMLYIAMGDGGAGGDPLGHGQNLGTLLGAMLRIDVDGGTPYAIPGDNPFVGDQEALAEIWSYGLRNPWRFSFDRQTGDLYVADVGQASWEEVDVQAAESGGGENYGWNIMEGAHCYNATTCDQTGLTLPVQEYSHADGCSITGGYVYRGSRVPLLAGHYLYADFCAGWVRSFRYEGGQALDLQDWSNDLMPGAGISSFGEDGLGELYILTLGGSLYRIVPASQ